MPNAESQSIVQLINACRHNAAPDWEQIEGAVYNRLRKSAYCIAGHSDASVTFGATSLTSETFLKLLKSDYRSKIRDVPHFFALMTVMMKQVFADHHRKKKNQKNGGNFNQIPFDLVVHGLEISCNSSFEAVNECMPILEESYPRQAKALSMRFFLAMSPREIASALEVSVSTVESDLRFAKAYVRKFVGD